MNTVSALVIDDIREASRTLVREFGFMGRNLAATSLPPSAVHALLEIDLKGPQTAAELCVKLNLEKSSISRLLKKLVRAGEVKESILPADARSKVLTLTAKGKATVNVAHEFAQQQVNNALADLSYDEIARIVDGLSTYAEALEAKRINGTTTPVSRFEIISGYRPGAIGTIAALFSRYFAQYYNFDQYFEQKVATELAEFTQRLSATNNALWLVMNNDQVLGSLAIDGDDLPDADVAHLRWFIMAPQLAGRGLGKQLLERAVDFCQDRSFREIHLWTVKGLDASSYLYDRYDFTIEEEFVDKQWGKETIEQKRVKRL
ncbi:bifunctional helix-turn-helix transcriptional regulator/GNAT family N-acetyltransferase [Agarilytica rhodophyticola]|uniref:bifunctional helix-turn-helix transcriptional regulator/GNAT family N-acetyltransferase n=1 Tax=Agarilytica rhodophyticola TaxID=1737490 RepID=UPI000B34388D|nr:helix-turn-helix domain-containing GNAT family N-acetyltransferase [Agarilytica rhodophyticola]